MLYQYKILKIEKTAGERKGVFNTFCSISVNLKLTIKNEVFIKKKK